MPGIGAGKRSKSAAKAKATAGSPFVWTSIYSCQHGHQAVVLITLPTVDPLLAAAAMVVDEEAELRVLRDIALGRTE